MSEQFKAVQPSTQVSKAAPVTIQLLAFTLGNDCFAVEVLRVQEIRGYTPLTPLPHAPNHVVGVMNLRGAIVPIVDLRMRLGAASVSYTKFTVIIIVSVGTRIVGLVVDTVWDVLSLSPDAVRPAPEFSHADTSYVSGVVQQDERLVLLLNLEALLSHDLSTAA